SRRTATAPPITACNSRRSSGSSGGAMQFQQAFPVAIIDEDFDAKTAAGRGMRQLAEAIEKEGLRVVSGLSYEDAERLVHVFNSESCWLVSIDGAERNPGQWIRLEQ